MNNESVNTSNRSDVEIIRDLVINTVDGWTQTMTVIRPREKRPEPLPAIFFAHGGGYIEGSPEEAVDLGIHLAAKLGITTFSVSYRLASEGNPTFPEPLTDLAFAWNWICARSGEWNICPDRMVAAGSSAGGCLVSLALTRQMITDVAALVVYWGPLDFVARWYDNGECPGAEASLLGTTYDANPALYHQASPLTHVSDGVPPALFIYGSQDNVVHPRQGRLGQAAWTSCGGISELCLFENIGHGVVGSNADVMEKVREKTEAFLRNEIFRLA